MFVIALKVCLHGKDRKVKNFAVLSLCRIDSRLCFIYVLTCWLFQRKEKLQYWTVQFKVLDSVLILVSAVSREKDFLRDMTCKILKYTVHLFQEDEYYSVFFPLQRMAVRPFLYACALGSPISLHSRNRCSILVPQFPTFP